MRAVALLWLAVALVCAQTVTRHHRGAWPLPSPPPSAYNISGVPWNQQINDFDCGAASSQMVLQYYAQSQAEFEALDQNDIMNVARTSYESGTWTTDIVWAAALPGY
jgi:hypothetical protein